MWIQVLGHYCDVNGWPKQHLSVRVKPRYAVSKDAGLCFTEVCRPADVYKWEVVKLDVTKKALGLFLSVRPSSRPSFCLSSLCVRCLLPCGLSSQLDMCQADPQHQRLTFTTK